MDKVGSGRAFMKVTIDHLSGSKSGRKEAFERESVLIGRGKSNDVSLDPFLDPTVSSQHAEIRHEQEGFVLYDMGSLNGTYLNGMGVRRATLKDGDEITLGQEGPRLQLRFSTGGHPKSGGVGHVFKRFQPRRGPSTAMETEIPLLNERVVSSNIWLYCAAVTLAALLAILIWKLMR